MATSFSQLKEKWAPIPLGLYGGHTIGSAGCLLTCGASILRDCGIDTDPGRLNRWLCQNGGYIKGNLIVFSAFGELAGLQAHVVDCEKAPAPVSTIQSVLDSGGFVIAKVDFTPGGTIQQHWVRVREIDDEDAKIMDPWLEDDQEYWMMPRYGLPGWPGPWRAIFRVAMYSSDQALAPANNMRQSDLSVCWDWR